MTPKEQAAALIDKFYGVECLPDDHYYDQQSTCSHQAKQCAIICVEQIIEATKKIDEDFDNWHGQTMSPEIYWEQVKEEINKL